MLFESTDHGLHLVLEIPDDGPVRLLHVGAPGSDVALPPEDQRWAYRLVEIRAAGEDHDYIEAGRYAGSAIGARLRHVRHSHEGGRIEVCQRDALTGIETLTELRIHDGVLVSRAEVRNAGSESVVLQAVSSFFLVGFTSTGEGPTSLRSAVHIPRNGWYAEFQWSRHLASDLGLNSRFAFGSRHETVQSTGLWCSSNYLPMGALENTATGEMLIWEIMHGGSWSWQVGETAGQLYLHVAGPTDNESSWFRTLHPGETLCTVPCIVAPARSFDDAIGALTRHRRRSRLAPARSPVVFNDYMNCLMGDPTEETILPLIDTAAALGAEVYCMDAGWYAKPGERWSNILGSWDVDPDRFPHGLGPVFDRIRSAGLIPGIWFEIEAMTANCPGQAERPRDWFFERHGKAVLSHRRLQLDFRNPDVRAFARNAVARLLEAGCRYIKMDYNFDSGPGSELGAESVGQSLIDYEEAVLGWLDALQRDFPDLLIEHCASGGMRLGRPYLDRANNVSNSDEGDPLQVARIAAAATTILLPEQNGTWVLPSPEHDLPMIAFTTLCGIVGRPILAGGSERLKPEQTDLIREGVALYKQLRGQITRAEPAWPIGLPDYHSPWVCLTLKDEESDLIAVWRREAGAAELSIPLMGRQTADLLYPSSLALEWQVTAGTLRLSATGPSGYLFRVK